jgi:hypothetical protein
VPWQRAALARREIIQLGVDDLRGLLLDSLDGARRTVARVRHRNAGGEVHRPDTVFVPEIDALPMVHVDRRIMADDPRNHRTWIENCLLSLHKGCLIGARTLPSRVAAEKERRRPAAHGTHARFTINSSSLDL